MTNYRLTRTCYELPAGTIVSDYLGDHYLLLTDAEQHYAMPCHPVVVTGTDYPFYCIPCRWLRALDEQEEKQLLDNFASTVARSEKTTAKWMGVWLFISCLLLAGLYLYLQTRY